MPLSTFRPFQSAAGLVRFVQTTAARLNSIRSWSHLHGAPIEAHNRGPNSQRHPQPPRTNPRDTLRNLRRPRREGRRPDDSEWPGSTSRLPTMPPPFRRVANSAQPPCGASHRRGCHRIQPRTNDSRDPMSSRTPVSKSRLGQHHPLMAAALRISVHLWTRRRQADVRARLRRRRPARCRSTPLLDGHRAARAVVTWPAAPDTSWRCGPRSTLP
jgi:hypothetical protein